MANKNVDIDNALDELENTVVHNKGDTRIIQGVREDSCQPPTNGPLSTTTTEVFRKLDDHLLGEVPPVWASDSSTELCKGCCSRFSWTRRRHHCRACGEVFCGSCCHKKFNLKFASENVSRVCEACFNVLNGSTEVSNIKRKSALRQPENSQPSNGARTVMFSDGLRPGTGINLPEDPENAPPAAECLWLANFCDPHCHIDFDYLKTVRITNDLYCRFEKVYLMQSKNREYLYIYSDGLSLVNAPELALLLYYMNDEFDIKFIQGLCKLFLQIYIDALNGKYLSNLDTVTCSRFISSFSGFLVVKFEDNPYFEKRVKLPFHKRPVFFAFGVLESELSIAKSHPLRLLTMMGVADGFFPWSIFTDTDRDPIVANWSIEPISISKEIGATASFSETKVSILFDRNSFYLFSQKIKNLERGESSSGFRIQCDGTCEDFHLTSVPLEPFFTPIFLKKYTDNKEPEEPCIGVSQIHFEPPISGDLSQLCLIEDVLHARLTKNDLKNATESMDTDFKTMASLSLSSFDNVVSSVDLYVKWTPPGVKLGSEPSLIDGIALDYVVCRRIPSKCSKIPDFESLDINPLGDDDVLGLCSGLRLNCIYFHRVSELERDYAIGVSLGDAVKAALAPVLDEFSAAKLRRLGVRVTFDASSIGGYETGTNTECRKAVASVLDDQLIPLIYNTTAQLGNHEVLCLELSFSVFKLTP